jgi:hypothetical protein
MATTNQTSTARLINTADAYVQAANIIPLVLAICAIIGRAYAALTAWAASQRDYSRYCVSSARTIDARTQAAQTVSPALDAPLALPVTHDESGIPYALVAHEDSQATCAVLTERDLVPVMASGILAGAVSRMVSRREDEASATVATPRKRTTTTKKASKGEKVSVAANDATTERVFPAGLGVELGRAVKEVLAYEVSRLTYRELQTLAKSKGIRANQSAEALRAALTN